MVLEQAGRAAAGPGGLLSTTGGRWVPTVSQAGGPVANYGQPLSPAWCFPRNKPPAVWKAQPVESGDSMSAGTCSEQGLADHAACLATEHATCLPQEHLLYQKSFQGNWGGLGCQLPGSDLQKVGTTLCKQSASGGCPFATVFASCTD